MTFGHKLNRLNSIFYDLMPLKKKNKVTNSLESLIYLLTSFTIKGWEEKRRGERKGKGEQERMG